MREYFVSKTKLATEVRPGMGTPCLEWIAAHLPSGYGLFGLAGKVLRAHRVVWEFAHGPIPAGLWVLHKCDNPSCVAIEHLFLGTAADNSDDMIAKGRDRKAFGDANGSRLYPERLRPCRGDANGSRLHPESRPRGDANGSRRHPERLPRGEKHVSSKLTEDNVRFIFQLRTQGWSQRRIAAAFGVTQGAIYLILARKHWAHVDLGTREAQP